MSRLDENIGAVGFDNLIAGVNPPAEVFSVKLMAGQGVYERGTLLAKSGDTFLRLGKGVESDANAVLAETVNTEETTEAIAYRTGHFNTNALIVGAEYEITAEDKEALRSVGILVSDAMEI